jgi:hypothetical protein
MPAHVCCNRDTFHFHLLTQLVLKGTILRETESGRDQTVEQDLFAKNSHSWAPLTFLDKFSFFTHDSVQSPWL